MAIPTTASYIIYIDGTIKAINGTTGNIDYSGTDASAVIQRVIDSLPITGGKIHLKRGQYDLNNGLVLFGGTNWTNSKSFVLEGESTLSTILNNNSINPAITMQCRLSVIRNLTVMGRSNSGDGIAVRTRQYGDLSTTHNEISDVYIKNNNIGISFGPHTYNVLVRNCLLELNRSYGTHFFSGTLPGSSDIFNPNKHTIINTYVANNGGDGIRIDGGHTHLFIGCEVGSNNGYAFYIDSPYNQIIECYTENDTLGGYYLGPKAMDNLISTAAIWDNTKIVFSGNTRFYNTWINGRTIQVPNIVVASTSKLL